MYIIQNHVNLPLNKDIHNYETRNKNNYFIESFRGAFATNKLKHMGTTFFNKLPIRVKELKCSVTLIY